jgi:hypothetical protein
LGCGKSIEDLGEGVSHEAIEVFGLEGDVAVGEIEIVQEQGDEGVVDGVVGEEAVELLDVAGERLREEEVGGATRAGVEGALREMAREAADGEADALAIGGLGGASDLGVEAIAECDGGDAGVGSHRASAEDEALGASVGGKEQDREDASERAHEGTLRHARAGEGEGTLVDVLELGDHALGAEHVAASLAPALGQGACFVGVVVT